MSETSNLKLPLLAAAQAQKHVTMNEALTRVDAALQLSVKSRTLASPPVSIEGEVYLVAAAGLGIWETRDGALAFSVGGGWDFLTPMSGWKIWVEDEAVWVVFDGTDWIENPVAVSPFGAGLSASVIEFDEILSAEGTGFTTSGLIPASSCVMAVTGRLIDGFDGGVANWSLGIAGSEDRYGSGLGVVSGAWVRGLTGQPQSYYADTPLTLTASGGDFGSGLIRLSIHLFSFGLPRAA